MQKETAFKKKVLLRLKQVKKCWYLKTQEVARSGTPDILLCVNGFFVAIELKTSEGVLSELQKYNLEKIKASGGQSFVISPLNIDEHISFLKDIAEKGSFNRGFNTFKTKKKGDIKNDKTRL